MVTIVTMITVIHKNLDFEEPSYITQRKEESEWQSHKETTHASETVPDYESELLVMPENWVRLHKVGTKV